MKEAIKEKTATEHPSTHKTLVKRKKVARRFGSKLTKSNPSYRDNQNEEKGSFEESKDGYPEKHVTEDSAKSGE